MRYMSGFIGHRFSLLMILVSAGAIWAMSQGWNLDAADVLAHLSNIFALLLATIVLALPVALGIGWLRTRRFRRRQRTPPPK